MNELLGANCERLLHKNSQNTGWINDVQEVFSKSERRTADTPGGYRNGYGKPRQLALMNGTVTLRLPRVRDLEERFVSRLLPLFKRRTEEVGALLANAVRRLAPSRLSVLELVFLLVDLWAAGLYVKAGIEDTKAALLVLIGALADGRKVVLAVESGVRESTESWAGVLRDLKARGLNAPKLTIADGHRGIWSGLAQVYPTSAEQRCWNHKLRNVLDNVLDVVPLKRQPEVKLALHMIANAESQESCGRLTREFRREYGKVIPQAVERLERAWERMVACQHAFSFHAHH